MDAVNPVAFCMLTDDYKDIGQYLISTPKEKLICLSAMRVLLGNPFLDTTGYRGEILKRVESAAGTFKMHTTLRKGMLLVCVKEKDGPITCDELSPETPWVIK